MDPLSVVLELIKQFGLLAALVILAYVNYQSLIKREHKASTDQEKAHTAQQNAITSEFTKTIEESRELRERIENLEAECALNKDEAILNSTKLGETKIELEKMGKELASALVKSGRLEIEIKSLIEKVAVLETEKVNRMNELERERQRSEILDLALKAANEQIIQLRDRVSKLEGERDILLSIVRDSSKSIEPQA